MTVLLLSRDRENESVQTHDDPDPQGHRSSDYYILGFDQVICSWMDICPNARMRPPLEGNANTDYRWVTHSIKHSTGNSR